MPTVAHGRAFLRPVACWGLENQAVCIKNCEGYTPRTTGPLDVKLRNQRAKPIERTISFGDFFGTQQK